MRRPALMIKMNISTIFYENINARITEMSYLDILVLFILKKDEKNHFR